MANLITAKIDVRKLDKSRFFEGKPDANGQKPLYADIVLVALKQPGKYGDTHIVKQAKKKDEQVELPIIGNATERVFDRGSQSQGAPPPARRSAPQPQDEDVPF